MSTPLKELCDRWREWARAADQSENGWESDFPQWEELISTACSAMRDPQHAKAHLGEIELCWSISEEAESMADCARQDVTQCADVLRNLARSDDPKVRWQVYSAVAETGVWAEPLLRAGLDDPDPYCRRRALLALAPLRPKDARDLWQRYRSDPDPYIRRAAEQFRA